MRCSKKRAEPAPAAAVGQALMRVSALWLMRVATPGPAGVATPAPMRLPLLALLRAAALAAACLLPPHAVADGGVRVDAATIRVDEDAYLLDADFTIELPEEFDDLVSRGIAVHFALEFELVRVRDWWFNRSVSTRRQLYRLSYYPITRSYRLSSGPLQQSFDSLDAALRSLARVRGWPIASWGDLSLRKEYRAGVRLQLDRSLLPKPFQLKVLSTDAWTLDSGWHRWVYQPGKAP